MSSLKNSIFLLFLFFCNLSKAQSDNFDMKQMVSLSGTCLQLQVASQKLKNKCTDGATFLYYKSGRASFLFSSGGKPVSFSGTKDKKISPKKYELELDIITTISEKGVAQATNVSGKCEIDGDPQKEPSVLHCVATSSLKKLKFEALLKINGASVTYSAEEENPKKSSSINQDFLPYIKEFLRQATLRNVNLDLESLKKLSINYSFDLSDYNTLGECSVSNHTIGISESYWVTASHSEREALIFHELGHCLLGRTHENGMMPISGGTIYKSIMNSFGDVLMSKWSTRAVTCKPGVNPINCALISMDAAAGARESYLEFAPTDPQNFYNRFRKVYFDELFGAVGPNPNTTVASSTTPQNTMSTKLKNKEALEPSANKEQESDDAAILVDEKNAKAGIEPFDVKSVASYPKIEAGLQKSELMKRFGKPVGVSDDGLRFQYSDSTFCSFMGCFVEFSPESKKTVSWTGFKPEYTNNLAD